MDKVYNDKFDMLPSELQREVMDFIDFLAMKVNRIIVRDNTLSDTDYLKTIPDMEESIIAGMNTPLKDCLEDVGL